MVFVCDGHHPIMWHFYCRKVQNVFSPHLSFVSTALVGNILDLVFCVLNLFPPCPSPIHGQFASDVLKYHSYTEINETCSKQYICYSMGYFVLCRQ